jgi:hypothetical protein
MPVPLIQEQPPGYFIRVSITTPVVSASKNYLIIWSFLLIGAPKDILSHFRILVTVSEAKRLLGTRVQVAVLEAKRLQIYNGYM